MTRSGYAADMMLSRDIHVLGEEVHVIGPCPGCESWQLDYTDRVVNQYVPFQQEHVLARSLGYKIDLSEWYLVLEAVLREHYDECAPLRELVGPIE